MGLHVKYPSMERQDLTQAQLGSFKFTPVDEVVREPRSFHPLLLEQYTQSLQNAGFSQHMTSPNLAADPSFFNHHIKPSLDSSRLQYGPAAVRAAVESASMSPQKRYSNERQGNFHPNVHSFHPQGLSSSIDDSTASMYTSELNSAPMSDNGIQAFSNANTSLLRALEAEQQAHEATKANLEQEINTRLEAESEAKRLVEHNKSLLNSILLLQSTVKHMVQKESEPERCSQVVVGGSARDHNSQTEAEKAYGSIPPNTLAKCEMPNEITGSGESAMSMINLDLLRTPDPNDVSEQAQLQRTLRRQMGLTSESEQQSSRPPLRKDLNAEYRHGIESIVKETVLRTQMTNGANPKVEHKQTTMISTTEQASTRDEVLSQAATSDAPTASRSLATSGDTYELPASFLDKYSKRPNVPEVPLPQTPSKATLTAVSATKTREFVKQKNPRRVIYMPDSPMINWKVDGRHHEELRGSYGDPKSSSRFQTHPLRYVPTMADENIFRTVMIDFIPFGTPYSDVLAHIRGGTLESIQLYGPVGDATDFVTARIIYTDESGAFALYRYGQDPGIKIGGQQVRVWQVLEPTYPKNRELEEATYVNGHTRILMINTPANDIDTLLKRKLRRQAEQGLILDIGRSHDGVSMVEFTSIEESTKALRLLLDDPDFGGSDFDFDDDYCAARYT